MRALLVTIAALAAAGPAFALHADDTMKAWGSASAEERTELLDKLFGKHVGLAIGAETRKCLDDASKVPGHADLPISEVYEVCRSSYNGGDPV